MLATEAHQVRLQALAAHAEAAVEIEHANNAGRGLSQYELDLHGLHATEAVDALDKRSAAPPYDCACSGQCHKPVSASCVDALAQGRWLRFE